MVYDVWSFFIDDELVSQVEVPTGTEPTYPDVPENADDNYRWMKMENVINGVGEGKLNIVLMHDIKEFTVNANAANGTLDKTTVETTDLEAKFKFTPEFIGENIVNVYTTETNTVPVTIMVTEKYAGPIYVSKDGDDANEGSEESPVASIAKAIELAQGKSGQVIIKEGTYVENGIIINDDIAITTVGDVILDGNGARYFDIKSGDVKIANVTPPKSISKTNIPTIVIAI